MLSSHDINSEVNQTIIYLLIWYESVDVNIADTCTDQTDKSEFQKARIFIEYPEASIIIYTMLSIRV